MDAVADTEGIGAQPGRVGAPGWQRVLGAVALAIAVTAAVTIPMGYQARATRTVTDTTTDTVPTAVLGATLSADQLTAPAQVIRLEPAEDLRFSAVGPTEALAPLDGSELIGSRAWIVVSGIDVLFVRFWLNDPTGSGPPDQVDQVAPFTLVAGPLDDGVAPLDLDALPSGGSTVLVELNNDDGTVEYQRASFSTT